MNQSFEQIKSVSGSLKLPGDKSISHRSVMFASLAKGKSIIYNCLQAADIESSINCFRNLGCEISRDEATVTVIGQGYKGFRKPIRELDAGNSGTTARLISGILAMQDFESVIVGDESLSTRPMQRIVDPLISMGADVSASATGSLPLRFKPSKNLHGIEFKLPVASAQLKSAVLLAGLHLKDKTTVIETETSRNHTETLLNLNSKIEGDERRIFVSKNDYPAPFEIDVPSDISSAAFFIVLTLLLKNSTLVIENVLLNETRTGILKILQLMGADISIQNEKVNRGETSGDLIVKSSKLKNIPIPASLVPNIIDEIPILTIAGLFADGDFEIRNAKELRYKESDRIAAVCQNLKKMGVTLSEFEDGFKVEGEMAPAAQQFESFGDHRIAMSFSVLSALLPGGGSVENYECVKISNPKFLTQLRSIITK